MMNICIKTHKAQAFGLTRRLVLRKEYISPPCQVKFIILNPESIISIPEFNSFGANIHHFQCKLHHFEYNDPSF